MKENTPSKNNDDSAPFNSLNKNNTKTELTAFIGKRQTDIPRQKLESR